MVEEPHVDAYLDCRGYSCPGPVFMIKEKMEMLASGQVLKVDADDPAAEEDVTRWAKRTGHDILSLGKTGRTVTFYIRKGKEATK
jgi:tRNA 2-thiouridine synthesizing protein A